MKLSTIFRDAASKPSGFSAEQHLANRGLVEIGRRTNAAAWTTPDATQVVRISDDALGSSAFFSLAQEMSDNPYMPVVYGQATLPSGDHIACVEKLMNPSQKETFARLAGIRADIRAGHDVAPELILWKERIENCAMKTKAISDVFMSTTNAPLDIDSLPEPGAFREASRAIIELTESVNRIDGRYVPGPDMNPTNIMWRETGGMLQPVLYDPLIRQNSGAAEVQQTERVRQRLGLERQHAL
jgi:hypothetical protein